MRRRRFMGAGLQAGVLASAGFTRSAFASEVLRFGTTPVFLDDQTGFLSRWADYLSRGTGTRVEFVSRRSYRDIMALLRNQELEAAWICGYPWVTNRSQLRGLCVPRYHGQPLYQSYLVVPSTDTGTHRPQDLEGKVFAYSDPDSNSGFLVPRTTLMKAGIDPDRHFARSFYTWGHRNVVSAVASGLAHAGAVDGYVWDTLQRVAPALVAKTRVAWRSESFGFPPLAVRASLDPQVENRLRAALLTMVDDPSGKGLLAELNLTGFGGFEPSLFDGIAALAALNAARTG